MPATCYHSLHVVTWREDRAPPVSQSEEGEADSDVALQGEAHCQQDGAVEGDVGHGQQDGDQPGEGPRGGDGRPEERDGEDEDGRAEVEDVHTAQADHQADIRPHTQPDSLSLPVERVDVTSPRAEDRYEDNISQDPNHCSHGEEESLQPPLQIIHGNKLL